MLDTFFELLQDIIDNGWNMMVTCFMREDRVPLIERSWDPGSEEMETQGGNGRREEERQC